MATVKGQNLRIFLRSANPGPSETPLCIAAATTCTLHCALDVQEDTTKDTEGDWIEQEPVGLNWDVQTEALVIDTINPDTEHALDRLTVGALFEVSFSKASGQDSEESVMNMKGIAILSDLQITAQNQEFSVCRAAFTGHGELEQVTPNNE